MTMTLPLPLKDQPERTIYTVTRLNREVRQLLERGLPALWIEGEVSNFSESPSGHWYFSLKDRTAQVRCVMWRSSHLGLGFTPTAGQAVVARARVSLYEARGEYQLTVERLEKAGLGALQQAFERLKEKLSAEGLFASERKRELPRLPARIGLVTSPSGAALRDILHVLERRFPASDVLIYPTPVQGAAAAPAIVEALRIAGLRRECDVLIVARGGGSLEDLWAFNDERVARAIVASPIPVVSAVGHEIDFTIADFAADVRAPTPSRAAELVVPDAAACLATVARTADRLRVAMSREQRALRERCTGLALRLKLANPGLRLMQKQQRLDDLTQRLAGAVRSGLSDRARRVSDRVAALAHASPERPLRAAWARHALLTGRLQHAVWVGVSRAEHRLGLAVRGLHAVSPLGTLSRGFAVITRSADGALVTHAAQVSSGTEIDARLASGRLKARVIDTKD